LKNIFIFILLKLLHFGHKIAYFYSTAVKIMNKKAAKISKAPKKSLSKDAYKQNLHSLQVELVKLQRHLIESNGKILVILEGRDAAGKDGSIKRIIQHLSPRETKVVALGKPSDRDRTTWYFQRYVPYLPAAQELVLFNRSWYNRAGVERVMGFCSESDYEQFITSVPDFEHLLVRSGITLIKYYLDISKNQQKKRLRERIINPLKQWKRSPIDDQAIRFWKQYSQARNEMLLRSHNSISPWTIVNADDKHQARLNIIRDLLHRLSYKGKNKKIIRPNSKIVFHFAPSHIKSGRLAS
jgi:polyphosphate kinase 2